MKAYPSEHTMNVKIDEKFYTMDNDTYQTLKSIIESNNASDAFMAVFFLGLKTGRIREKEIQDA